MDPFVVKSVACANRRGPSRLNLNPRGLTSRAKEIAGPRVRFQRGDAMPWKLERVYQPKDNPFMAAELLGEFATEQEADRELMRLISAAHESPAEKSAYVHSACDSKPKAKGPEGAGFQRRNANDRQGF